MCFTGTVGGLMPTAAHPIPSAAIWPATGLRSTPGTEEAGTSELDFFKQLLREATVDWDLVIQVYSENVLLSRALGSDIDTEYAFTYEFFTSCVLKGIDVHSKQDIKESIGVQNFRNLTTTLDWKCPSTFLLKFMALNPDPDVDVDKLSEASLAACNIWNLSDVDQDLETLEFALTSGDFQNEDVNCILTVLASLACYKEKKYAAAVRYFDQSYDYHISAELVPFFFSQGSVLVRSLRHTRSSYFTFVNLSLFDFLDLKKLGRNFFYKFLQRKKIPNGERLHSEFLAGFPKRKFEFLWRVHHVFERKRDVDQALRNLVASALREIFEKYDHRADGQALTETNQAIRALINYSRAVTIQKATAFIEKQRSMSTDRK